MSHPVRRSTVLMLAALGLGACTAPADHVVAADAGSPEVDAHPPAIPAHYAWARLLSGPSQEDEIDAVASDAAGNVYVSGKFETSLAIEGYDHPLVSAGHADIMLAKYAPDGTLQWVRQFGGLGEDNVFDAACDHDGNLVLSGYFAGSVDFGGITLSTSGPSDLDMMVFEISPQGEVIWAVRGGGPKGDGGNEINIAPDGTIVVLAGSEGDFEAGSVSFAFPGPGQYSILLALDPANGHPRWGSRVAGTGVSRMKCLAVDGAGNVFAGGDYSGHQMVFGPNRTDTLPTSRGIDAYLTSWTPDGQLRWSKAWGGTDADLCKGVEAAASGDLYVVGYFSTGARFGTQTFTVAHRELFVWKLDTDGQSIWINQVSAGDDLTGAESMLTPGGGVMFGHAITSNTTYGSTDGNPRTVALPATGTRWPSFVAYTPSGVVDFQLFPEANTGDASMDEISRSGQRVYLDVPIFNGTQQFGVDTRSSNGTKDALIVALDL